MMSHSPKTRPLLAPRRSRAARLFHCECRPMTETPQPAADGNAAPKKRRERRQLYSAEECFANMTMLWRHHGRPPRCCEADKPPSMVGHGAYKRRSGSWMRALEAFAAFSGLEMRQTCPAPPLESRAAPFSPPVPGVGWTRDSMRSGRRQPRAVALSLRFQVLTRDRFRCTACGNSPAADPACVLHVDHVEHWSRGGRTELANLRSLCAACNLGRGAREEG